MKKTSLTQQNNLLYYIGVDTLTSIYNISLCAISTPHNLITPSNFNFLENDIFLLHRDCDFIEAEKCSNESFIKKHSLLVSAYSTDVLYLNSWLSPDNEILDILSSLAYTFNRYCADEDIFACVNCIKKQEVLLRSIYDFNTDLNFENINGALCHTSPNNIHIFFTDVEEKLLFFNKYRERIIYPQEFLWI